MRDVFKGKSAILITKHGKEQAIAPVLKNVVGMDIVPTTLIDTDEFGTFTGTVERKGSQSDAAMHKIKAGISKLGPGVYLASEGSFYPHPQIPFITLNTEMVVMYDETHKIKISGNFTTSDVHVFSKTVHTLDELFEAIHQSGFPDNKLVLRNEQSGRILTDLNTHDELIYAFKDLNHNQSGILVQTDLRANRNTWRMKNIEKACFDLALKMDCFCPQCEKPGFSVTQVNRGLPCSNCRQSTEEIKEYIFTCEHCNHIHVKNLLSQNKRADASLCNYCNP